MVYVYDGRTLYTRDVTYKNGRTETIYFFRKRVPPKGVKCDLPEGHKVLVNERTGLFYIENE